VTATINYDRHIVNLIDELSRTGHVTHTKYKKKSVTLHHNGGVRFSHQTILNIWKTRPASAHFDIDAVGDPAQYVEAHEYAWAVANTRGQSRDHQHRDGKHFWCSALGVFPRRLGKVQLVLPDSSSHM
jgi:hypothetical protein